jgi:hypothetical protein
VVHLGRQDGCKQLYFSLEEQWVLLKRVWHKGDDDDDDDGGDEDDNGGDEVNGSSNGNRFQQPGKGPSMPKSTLPQRERKLGWGSQ